MRTGITEIRVTVRQNLGNYEHKEVGVTYSVGENENAAKVLKEMEDFCYGRESVVMEVKTEIKTTPPVLVETTTEAVVALPEGTTLEVTRPEEEVKQKKTSKRSTKKNTVTAVAYDRENEFHKKEMGFLLDEFIPGWRKNANLKQKAITISTTLAGKDFLDEEGKILDSFRSEVSEWV